MEDLKLKKNKPSYMGANNLDKLFAFFFAIFKNDVPVLLNNFKTKQARESPNLANECSFQEVFNLLIIFSHVHATL